MYNPVNGACYDGLEVENININQGAESSLCYLLARLIIEDYPLEVGLKETKSDLKLKEGIGFKTLSKRSSKKSALLKASK